MAKAKKLPSGSWRCQVYSHTETVDGKQKRIYKSFTSDDPSNAGKREAEYLAAEFAMSKKKIKEGTFKTLGSAWDEYIEHRSSLLSPSTIREYKRSRKCDLQGIIDMNIYDITQAIVQEEINRESKNHSPKSIRNMHGLLSAILKDYRKDFTLNTVLPARVRAKIYVPSDDEVSKIMDSVMGTAMEIPVLLAAFGPMRRGEICALHSRNIKGNVVHVCDNMVKDEHNKWVIKRPKSYAGDRYITFASFVIEKLTGKQGRIVNLYPSQITDRFEDVLKRAKIPHFRFHDLRHYSASIQHAIGIPDAYIMERGGWGSDGVLKAVYRHTMDAKAEQMNEKANDYFSKIANPAKSQDDIHATRNATQKNKTLE